MALASRRVKQYDLDPADLEAKIQAALGTVTEDELADALTASVKDIVPGQIVKAVVDSVDDRTGLVVMDIGGKSEGSIPLAEFGETMPKKGDSFEVFYDGLDENDTAVISKKRADRLRAWERVSQKYREGDEVQGVVQRKIKGGLLVDVEGVNVFLPASQVNLRRTHDILSLIHI